MTERELTTLIGNIHYHTGRFKAEAEGNPVIRRRKGTPGIVLSHDYAEELLADMIAWAKTLQEVIPEHEVSVSKEDTV